MNSYIFLLNKKHVKYNKLKTNTLYKIKKSSDIISEDSLYIY